MLAKALSSEEVPSGKLSAQVQCITHFLKLPIEDDFLDQLEDADRGAAAVNNAAGQGKAEGASSRVPQGQIPFKDQRNPVMAQVRILDIRTSYCKT